MKIKAKEPYRLVRAFTGQDFVNYEWRPVPEGGEDEALRLEAAGYAVLLRDVPEPEPEAPIDATPAAAALAELVGIDLAEVAGSGADGRILKSDVERLIDEEE